MPALDAIRQQIRANYFPDEDEAVKRLAASAALSADDRRAISSRAAALVRAVRAPPTRGLWRFSSPPTASPPRRAWR